jgi:chemosensory pili system protein ChpA (sensor histidine kinase/response regulator)
VETTQTRPLGVDVSAFGALAAEVERSLESVEAALEERQSLAAVCRDLAKIRAVLDVADLCVIGRIVQEIESLLGAVSGESAADADRALGVCRRALTRIRRALSDLATGSRCESVEGLLQDLINARESERASAAQVLHPDLTRLPPPRDGHTAQAVPESLRSARARFQKALLSWLRDADDRAPVVLREVVESIESLFADPVARAPWWIAAAFFDLLVEGSIDARADARRICAGLDLHLRKITAGPAEAPEALMREMLQFIAVRASASERVAVVRQTYFGDVQTKAIDADAILAADRGQQWEILKQSLEKAAVGNAQDLRVFQTALEEAARLIPSGTGLESVLEQLLRAAAEIADQRDQARASLAFEMATALLFVQDALNAPPGAAAALDRAQVEAMVRRLRAVSDGVIDHQAQGANSNSQNRAAQRLVEQAATDRVAVELSAALTVATEGLEAFFADRTAHAGLEAADRSLIAVYGVLQLMTEDRPAAAVAYCREEIARFRADAASCSGQDFARVASVLSGLSYYVAQSRFGGADFTDIMHKAGAPDCTRGESSLMPQENMDVEVVDITEAMELELPQALNAEEETFAAPAQALPEIAPEEEGWDQPADADLLRIFIDEALEVLAAARGASAHLREDPTDADALATIRRGFHTLKGSGRMVGLHRLAEAAAEVERVLNGVIERCQPASQDLTRLLDFACELCGTWIAELQCAGRVRIDAEKLSQWTGQLKRGEPLTAQSAIKAVAAAEPETGVPQPESVPSAADVATDQSVEIGAVRISRALYGSFMREAQQLLSALTGEFETRKAQAGPRLASQEMLRYAHTLSGIAGTVRIAAIRQLAGAMEEVAELLHREALDTSVEDEALFDEALTALQTMIASVAARTQPQVRTDLEGELKSLAQRLADQLDAAGVAEQQIAEISSSTISIALADAQEPTPDATLEFVSSPRLDRRRNRLQDDIDLNLLPVFLDEAADLGPRIGQELRDWRARPAERALPQSMARLLHTFKGSARMAGAMALGELTHSMEERVSVAAQLAVIPESVFDGLEHSFDRMGVLLEGLAALLDTSSGERRGGDAMRADAAQTDRSLSFSLESAPPTDPDDNSRALPPGGTMSEILQPQATAQTAQFVRAPLLLRVHAERVEQLVAEAGEVAIARSRLEGEMRAIRGAARDMSGNLTRLRALAREMEIQAQSQMQSRMVHNDGAEEALDPLEFDRFTRLQELTRFIAESAADVATLQQNMSRNLDNCEAALEAQARMTRTLQDGLMGVRMVPFASLNERLFRVVRLTAREAAKRVKLDIRGDKVELDRGVIERIIGPLEHLLRNAVVHGIETTQQRLQAGKPAAGEITLDVRQEGNEVRLTLRDDGRGLDIGALRAKAIAAGLTKADLLLADSQIVQFAFAAGVSTAENVTEVAGRGVGLDVVRSEVAALGGRVEVSFEPAKGTAFSIHLPLMVAVMQALLVRCGRQLFALPTLMVKQVRAVGLHSLARLYEVGRIDWRGEAFPVHELGVLLGMEGPVDREMQRNTPVILISGGAQRVAVQVDEIAGHEEVVVKNIGAQVARVTGITGAAVRGGGEIVLILDPVQLARRSPAQPSAPSRVGRSASEAPLAAAATVLVVDDSATVRKITSRILARQGYNVVEARDGLEALEKLRDGLPGVMLLDVEMPRMDGFELLRRLRDDPVWREIPVIVITSRTAAKHRKVAMDLGATLFLGKPFEEQDLLAQVARMTTKEQV